MKRAGERPNLWGLAGPGKRAGEGAKPVEANRACEEGRGGDPTCEGWQGL